MTTPTVLHVTTTPAKRPSDAVLIRRAETIVNRARRARGLPPLPPAPSPSPPKPKARREWKPPLRLDVASRWACRAMMGTYARRLGRPVAIAETLQEGLRLMLVHEQAAG